MTQDLAPIDSVRNSRGKDGRIVSIFSNNGSQVAEHNFTKGDIHVGTETNTPCKSKANECFSKQVSSSTSD